MKNSSYWLAALTAAFLITTGCNKKSGDTWDDNTTSMGSYKRPSQRVLWGDSKTQEVTTDDHATAFSEAHEEEFIPLKEEDLKQQFSDMAVAQPKTSPGEEGSYLPGIDGFNIPTASLAAIFKTVHFNTDEHVVKSQDDIAAISKMAAYLKSHPRTYIFVSGHCDQRGPEAYNLALGTRRANTVRSLLVQKGVNPEQIHTVSYGKEHLLDSTNTSSAWAKNRRAEFRIYQQR
jgi:peptidoglycan-associated lipoprotein